MAGENFCAESLAARRCDVSVAQTLIANEIRAAVAAAEDADLPAVYRALERAQSTIGVLRSDLEDLAYERERQMDAEGEQ
jgi:hypothetical protein